MTISVLMASDNGAKYIKDQIESILPYLNDDDELIISDDGSTDETLNIIDKYRNQYPNLILVEGPKKGVVHNFESMLILAKKDIILFSDQDDIWLPEKIPIVRQVFKNNRDISLMMHDMYMATNEQIKDNNIGKQSFIIRKRKHGVVYNL